MLIFSPAWEGPADCSSNLSSSLADPRFIQRGPTRAVPSAEEDFLFIAGRRRAFRIRNQRATTTATIVKQPNPMATEVPVLRPDEEERLDMMGGDVVDSWGSATFLGRMCRTNRGSVAFDLNWLRSCDVLKLHTLQRLIPLSFGPVCRHSWQLLGGESNILATRST